MKKISLFIVLFIFAQCSFAQIITGIINDYAVVNSITNNIVLVNSTAGFNLGDKVMLIKMKGATINTSNNSTYGDTISMNEAGKYVFSNIIALTGTSMTLSPFCQSFSDNSFLQIVRVPIFPNPTVVGTLTCAPWNGSTGGIIAFETPGTLTLNGDIDASGLGYRGGDVFGAGIACGDTNYFSPLVGFGPNGKKGEGVADYVLLQQCGRGKLANGGGSAHASNSGAGGGGNGGTGGLGSNETDTCGTVGNKSIGGISLAQQFDRLFMGGGGGAPQNNDNQIVDNGGNGGGIIFIKANEISANAFSILSIGGTPFQTNDEGAPGGGAGGSVLLDCPNFTGFLFLDVSGGNGGDVSNIIFPQYCQGPGGGGGGGLIQFSTPAIPPNVFFAELGGSAGQILNPATPCFGTSYGATDGGIGQVKFDFNYPNIFTSTPVNIGNDTVICGNSTITLSANGTYSSYLWENSNSTSINTINGPGTYYITVFNNGCTGSDTITVNPDTSLIANFSYQLKYGCDFDTLIVRNLSIGATQYEWDFNDNASINNISYLPSPTHLYANQGNYTVRLIAKNLPCTDTIFVNINISHPLVAQLAMLDKVCLGDSILAQGKFLSIPVNNLSYSYEWGDGTTSLAPSGDKWHTFQQAGTYVVKLTITDTLGCTSSDTVSVYVAPNNFASFTVSTDSICVGQAFTFKDSMPSTTQQFTWDFGDNNSIIDLHNPSHAYEIPGVYNVSLTASEIFAFPNPPICPSVTTTKQVTVLDYPIINLGKDTSICPGLTQAILINNILSTGEIYQWNTGDISNSILVTKPGYYWATKSNGMCQSTDSIWVKENCYLNIPNSFSPDGDGLNDYFIPRDLLSSGIYWFKMNIYNRWGEEIFATTIRDGRGWDGNYDGKLQPMGVYVYTIEVIYLNGITKNFKGNVTLIR